MDKFWDDYVSRYTVSTICWFRFEKNIVHDQGVRGLSPLKPLPQKLCLWREHSLGGVKELTLVNWGVGNVVKSVRIWAPGLNLARHSVTLACNWHRWWYILHPFNYYTHCPGLPRWAGTRKALHFTEARDSEWQWHQLGHMQVCTSLQTDNHASTPTLSFLQAGCPSCRPTNSVKALKATLK